MPFRLWQRMSTPKQRFPSGPACAILMAAFLLLAAHARAQTNVTFTVSADTDDADQTSDGTMYVTDGSSYLNGYVGFRFQNVNIPAGATVTSATLEFYSNGNGTTSFSVDLTAQDADNPSTFTTNSSDISNRPRTSAQTLWSTGSTSYSVGDAILSPNFASSIQEVIERSGWTSGNSLVVITTPNSGNKGIFKRSGSTQLCSSTSRDVHHVVPSGVASEAGRSEWIDGCRQLSSRSGQHIGGKSDVACQWPARWGSRFRNFGRCRSS